MGQNAVTELGEMIQAAADNIPHPFWDADVPGSYLPGPLQPTVGNEKPHDLGDEKGIAFRFLIDSFDEFVWSLDSRGHLDEPGDIRPGKPRQQDSLGQSLPRKLA